MAGSIALEFSQRETTAGVTNSIAVSCAELRTVPTGTVQIDFQHVGRDRIPEPAALDGYVFGILL